jgi:TonB-linked SusC/RagA family outer membrane protein
MKVTLHFEKATIQQVLKTLEDQTGHVFLYKDDIFDPAIKYSVDFTDESFEEVLNSVCTTAGVDYEVRSNRQIILTEKEKETVTTITLQQRTVTGVVTDQSGQPLPGVTVVVAGTTTGTVTNADGNFSLAISPSAETLQFSFVGMRAQEVPIEGRTTFTVVMEEETIGIDEVVAIGYSVQKKSNLTGAVSTVNFEKELENRPLTNASQALGGSMTGLWVSQNSGQPGSDGATIRVRGFGTLNNSDPMVLIDGIEGNMSELNPNDIESITVLKDAASAAIYGSRAANGVILITTKMGDVSEKVKVTYNGYYGLQKMGERYDLISNSAEYMEIWNSAMDGGDPKFPAEVVEAFRNGDDPYLYPNTNFLDEVTRVAPITEHNISINSGSENVKNYFSINYLDHEGIYYNTNSTRFGITFNNETKVNEWLKVGGRFNAMRKITNEPYDGIGRVVYMIANGHPYAAPYTEDGRFGATQALYLSGATAGQPITDTRNPMPDLYNGLRQYTNNYSKANIFANIHLMDGLEFNTQYSGQYNNNLRDRYNEVLWCYNTNEQQVKPLDFPSTPNIERYTTDQFYQTFYSTLNFSKTFSDVHELGALIGMQSEDRLWKNVRAQKSDPPKAGLHQVSAGTSSPIAEGTRNQLRMLSYFGRVNYAYKSKYLAEFNFRADASSRFKSGNRWGFFPSASIGWRLSEEGFLKDGFFDELKIRASYGELGNQNLNDYWPFLTTITQTNGTSYNVGNALTPGAAVTALVDEDITWETTSSFDIGLDLRTFDDRLSAELDYFLKNTENILVQLPIPLVLGGVTAPYENVGEMTNTGVELSVNWRDRMNNGLSYNIGGNITYVQNEVTTFREGKSPDQLYLIREGYSYRTLYGFKASGVYQTNEEAAAHMHSNGYTPKAGDLKYEDKNSDGILDFNDKSEIGNTIPKYTYGIKGGLSYKGIDLNILLQGIAGVNVYTQSAWTEPLGISGGSVTTRWRDAWTSTNPSKTTPRIVVNDTWNRQESSFWANELSWLKVKNLQLGYTLPSQWIEFASLESTYVYINGQNILTFVNDDYEGFDPERDTFNNGYSQYPAPRIWSLGVNITF